MPAASVSTSSSDIQGATSIMCLGRSRSAVSACTAARVHTQPCLQSKIAACHLVWEAAFRLAGSLFFAVCAPNFKLTAIADNYPCMCFANAFIGRLSATTFGIFNIIVERSSSTQASNAFLARPSSLNPATHSLRGLQPFDRSMADGGSRGRRPRRSTPRCRRWLRAGSWFGSLCLLFCVCVRGNQNKKCR